MFCYGNTLVVIRRQAHVMAGHSGPQYENLYFTINGSTTNNINIRNSLPNEVVEADTANAFKYRLDKDWSNQDVLFDYRRLNWDWKCTNLYVIVICYVRCGPRGLPASVRTRWI